MKNLKVQTIAALKLRSEDKSTILVEGLRGSGKSLITKNAIRT